MEIQQPDYDVLEALFRAGGKATPVEIQASLNGHAVGSLAALRNRLRRLALRGYVIKDGPKYYLSLIGQENFLEDLGWREPESPLLLEVRKRKSYVLSVEVEPLAEGGYLASCPDIQGCHTEGATVAEALENLEDAARALLEMRAELGGHVLGDEYRPGRLLKAELVLPLQA